MVSGLLHLSRISLSQFWLDNSKHAKKPPFQRIRTPAQWINPSQAAQSELRHEMHPQNAGRAPQMFDLTRTFAQTSGSS